MRIVLDYPEYEMPEEREDLEFSPSLGGYVPRNKSIRTCRNGQGDRGDLDQALREAGFDPGEVKQPPIAGVNDGTNELGLPLSPGEPDLRNDRELKGGEGNE